VTTSIDPQASGFSWPPSRSCNHAAFESELCVSPFVSEATPAERIMLEP
jgi:hypothetical protein